MRRANVSTSDLAAAINVNYMTVWHWRAGVRTPDEDKLPLIAEICKCSVKDLISELKVKGKSKAKAA